MKTLKMGLTLVLLINLVFLSITFNSGAEVNYPTKTVTITVLFGAGGNMDIKARIVAKYLGDELGQSVVVKNKIGGSGIVGATEYLLEKPNTHNLIYLVDATTNIVPLYTKVAYTAEDFIPIIGVDTNPKGLFVNPKKTGIESFEDLIEYGKNKIIKFGSTGMGNDNYVISKALFNTAGLASDTIISSSSMVGLTNTLGGHIDVTFAPMNLARSYVEDGSLKPIGTFSHEPYIYDNGIKVPTFSSMGYNIFFESFTYFAIRKGTDEAIVNKLAAAISKVYENAEFQKKMANFGVIMKPLSSQQCKEFLIKKGAEVLLYSNLVKSEE